MKRYIQKNLAKRQCINIKLCKQSSWEQKLNFFKTQIQQNNFKKLLLNVFFYVAKYFDNFIFITYY